MKAKRNLIIFIIVTLASGWLGVLLDMVLTDQPKGNTLGMGLWLVAPFLAALLLRLFSRDWKDIGIKPNLKGNIKWYLLSLAIYPAVTVFTVGFAAILGAADISGSDANILIPLIAASFAVGLIKNIFEEFAWRGYLTPKLIALKLNDWWIYLISGLVWALFHVAYYLFFLPDSYFVTVSRVALTFIAILIMLCWNVMFVELYRLTKSVWPGVLMHAAEDAVPTLLVYQGGLIFTKAGDILFNPTSGIIATVLFVGTGLILRAVRINRDIDDIDIVQGHNTETGKE